MKRLTWLLIPALTFSLVLPAAPVLAADPPSPVSAAQSERPLAQGLRLIQFERLYPRGWANGSLLQVDLANPAITTDLVTAPGVNQVESLSAMAARSGAVAAVNGDFFDIGQTNIALGDVVKGGQFLQTQIPTWPNAAGVGTDRLGRLLDVTLDGTVILPGGSYPLGSINLPTVQSSTIGLYTPLWTLPRTQSMYGASQGREVIVRAGTVVSVSPTATAEPVPSDGFVLVGREEFAAPLAALKVGDPVSVSYVPKPALQWAVGGNNILVRNGKLEAADDRKVGPRTALGFSVDGRQMFLLTVDGRSEASGGVTLPELADLIRSFGAYNAIELDGGGSTTMVARLPGEAMLSLINRPSDGKERRIPNGVGIFAAPGSGMAKRLEIAATGDTAAELRLFPALRRPLTATAYDEQNGPASLPTVTWRASGNGSISADGVVRAGQQPGRLRVTASAGAMVTEREVRILGPVARIATSVDGLSLASGQSERFTVRGYDANGYMAPIDPADLTLTYDSQVLQVIPEAGGLKVTALKEGAGLITVVVQGQKAQISYAAGSGAATLAALDRLTGWSFAKSSASVTGSIQSAPGHEGMGVKLSYQFGEGATRAAYLQADPVLELPGRPESIGLWVNGDGKGAWLRAILVDGAGTNHTLNLARHVDWTGWRFVEASVPVGAVYPLKLYRVYPVETDATKQYSGDLVFDDLTVRTAAPLPAVVRPTSQAVAEPVLQLGDGGWAFGLMTGLSVPVQPASGADGEAAVVQQIQRVLAADPAFLLVDPVLVSPDAEVLIAREVAGRVPVVRLTQTARSIDQNGVRFLILGTEKGGLRATGFAQLQGLQESLNQSASDPAIKQVVVVARDVPTRFVDPREGALIARWLTEFRDRSGKEIAYVATGGASAGMSRTEGVPYLEVGGPAGPVIVRAGGNPWLWVE